MDKDEARRLLHQQLDLLEAAGYAALRGQIGLLEATEHTGESGRAYQIEIEVFWDHQPDGAIRILGSVDDGGWRAFVPLTESRLVQPAPSG
jgi:hypothetical protein